MALVLILLGLPAERRAAIWFSWFMRMLLSVGDDRHDDNLLLVERPFIMRLQPLAPWLSGELRPYAS